LSLRPHRIPPYFPQAGWQNNFLFTPDAYFYFTIYMFYDIFPNQTFKKGIHHLLNNADLLEL